MSLSATIIAWEGLTFYGMPGLGAFTFRTLEGWEGLPDARRDDVPRPAAHGSFSSPVYSAPRTVRVTGRCGASDERDTLLATLGSVFVFGDSRTRPLVITHAGRTLTADAMLTRFAPTPEVWGAGSFGWAAEWVATDPLRYGDPVALSTGFATPGGGLRTPLFSDGTVGVGRLDFGAPGSSGRLLLSNPGSAAASPQYTVSGPVPTEGFDIVCVDTGERMTFESGISAGSLVVLDSATGRVLLNGDSDRSGYLTVAQWFKIPAGGSRTVAFLSRGATTAATMTATVRPPWW